MKTPESYLWVSRLGRSFKFL